jgi:hypothetical protein
MDDEIQFAIATQKFQEAAAFEGDVIDKSDYAGDEPLSQSDEDYFRTTTTLDMSNRDQISTDHIKSFDKKVGQLKHGFKTEDQRVRFEAWRIKNTGNFHNAIRSKVNAKYADYQVAKFDNLIESSVRNNDPETANHWVDVMAQNELITEVRANKYRENITKGIAEVEEAEKKFLVNSLKPGIEDALGLDMDMQDAISYIDEQVGVLEEGGQINDVEAAEARKDLTNWAKDVSVDKARTERANKIEKTGTLADKLADMTFSTDDVVLSKIATNQKEKDFWSAIAAGYRQPVTAETTFEGNEQFVGLMTSMVTEGVGELEATNLLLTSRFIDRSISHAQYQLGLSLIKDPYPKYTADTLKAINEKSMDWLDEKGFAFGFDWMTDNEEKFHAESMKNLMYWMDDEKKATGKYPSPEEMYKEIRKQGVLVASPKNLPKEPKIARPVPKRSDPRYIGIYDEDKYEALEAGEQAWSEFYNDWFIK